jgi:hypothetical protein
MVGASASVAGDEFLRSGLPHCAQNGEACAASAPHLEQRCIPKAPTNEYGYLTARLAWDFAKSGTRENSALTGSSVEGAYRAVDGFVLSHRAHGWRRSSLCTF